MALTLARRGCARGANLPDPLAGEIEQDSASAEAAQEQDRTAGGQDAGAADRECMPCRGTGKVISKLGGEDHAVSCPWCEGSGQRLQGVDAQAHWQTEQGGTAATTPPES